MAGKYTGFASLPTCCDCWFDDWSICWLVGGFFFKPPVDINPEPNKSRRNISIQLTSSRTFTVAPYHWKIHSLGLLSVSGFVGAVISFFIGGRLIDFIANRMTARHGGIAEPEYRLPAMVFVSKSQGSITFSKG